MLFDLPSSVLFCVRQSRQTGVRSEDLRRTGSRMQQLKAMSGHRTTGCKIPAMQQEDTHLDPPGPRGNTRSPVTSRKTNKCDTRITHGTTLLFSCQRFSRLLPGGGGSSPGCSRQIEILRNDVGHLDVDIEFIVDLRCQHDDGHGVQHPDSNKSVLPQTSNSPVLFSLKICNNSSIVYSPFLVAYIEAVRVARRSAKPPAQGSCYAPQYSFSSR